MVFPRGQDALWFDPKHAQSLCSKDGIALRWYRVATIDDVADAIVSGIGNPLVQ